MSANQQSIPPLSSFGNVYAGADYHGLQMVKFWFNDRRYEVLVGSARCEKLRETYNGSAADYHRDCVTRIGTASFENQQAPTAEVVAFLNQWRQANHKARVERMTSQPERYGIVTEEELGPSPDILVPAHYVQGEGWVKTQEVEAARSMAGL